MGKDEVRISKGRKWVNLICAILTVLLLFGAVKLFVYGKMYKEVNDLIFSISTAKFTVDFEDKEGCTLHGTGKVYIDGNNDFNIDMENREVNTEYREKYKNMEVVDFEDKGGSVQTYKEAVSILPSIIDKDLGFNFIKIKGGVTEDSSVKMYELYETVEYDDKEKIVCKYSLICDDSGNLKEIIGEHFSGEDNKWEKHYVTDVTDIKNNRKQ